MLSNNGQNVESILDFELLVARDGVFLLLEFITEGFFVLVDQLKHGSVVGHNQLAVISVRLGPLIVVEIHLEDV